jgi:hypothetical protein
LRKTHAHIRHAKLVPREAVHGAKHQEVRPRALRLIVDALATQIGHRIALKLGPAEKLNRHAKSIADNGSS